MKDATLLDGTKVVDTIYIMEQLIDHLPPNALVNVVVTPIYFPQGKEYYVGFTAYKVTNDKQAGTVIYKPGKGSYYTMREAMQHAYIRYWELVEEGVITTPQNTMSNRVVDSG